MVRNERLPVNGCYSYRNAVIGSSFAAFRAGYKPAINPVTKQIITPAAAHAQGTINPVLKKSAARLPTRIPNTIPKKAPSKLMRMLSHKNCLRIFELLAPMDLAKPISRVRSLTATNIILVKPMAAPNNVIAPITIAAICT